MIDGGKPHGRVQRRFSLQCFSNHNYSLVLNRISDAHSDSGSSSRAWVRSVRELLEDETGMTLIPDTTRRAPEKEQRERISTDGGIERGIGSSETTIEETGHSERGVPNDDAHVIVAIPAYNEQSTIGSVVEQADPYVDTTIVIDDGSDDGTARRAREAGATVIEHERNRGYGAALQTAFWEAATRSVDHLIVLDGDNQHDPKDIPKLLAKQQETNAEVVIGSRFVTDSETDLPLYRLFGLEMINLLTNISIGMLRSGSRIADTQSGFRSYTGRAVQTLAADWTISDHMGASIDILYSAHQWDYRIEEVETTITYDVENSSNQNPVVHGLVLIANILEIVRNDRPKFFYGAVALCTTLIAFIIRLWNNIVK